MREEDAHDDTTPSTLLLNLPNLLHPGSAGPLSLVFHDGAHSVGTEFGYSFPYSPLVTFCRIRGALGGSAYHGSPHKDALAAVHCYPQLQR